MMKINSKKANTVISWTFYFVVIIFLFYYFSRIDFNQLSGIHFNLLSFSAAVILGILSISWGAFIWLLILKKLGAKNIFNYKRQLFFVYSKAWLARYIPGTAPWILGKIYFASTHGVSKKKLLNSSALEALMQIIATVLVALILILGGNRGLEMPSIFVYILIFGTIVSLLLIQPKIFNLLFTIGMKILRKDSSNEVGVNYNTLTIGLLLYSAGSLITALAMYLVVISVYPGLSSTEALYTMGVGILSGVIGMFAIFVPSGLGVREGVQIALYSAIMPLEIAIIVAIMLRLWSAIVDVGFFAISAMYNKGNIKVTN